MMIWVFPKIGVPQNGWFIMENRIKMDDLGGFPRFLDFLCFTLCLKLLFLGLVPQGEILEKTNWLVGLYRGL